MSAASKTWMDDAIYGMHYDLHAMATDTNLGAELTHEHLRERLERIKPDYVECDCKGHYGYSSYPTKVGYPAPGIVRDALRIHRDVTKELGLPLMVHFSGVWSGQDIEHHPDWCMRNSKGEMIFPRQDIGNIGGVACTLSPYVHESMIPQFKELIDEYDIDAIWVDGDNWAVCDCYCDRCRAEFTQRTGIKDAPVEREHPDWPTWRAFHRDLFVEYVRTYVDAVHQHSSTCLICSNWMYSMRQPGPAEVPIDFLSGDFGGCERAQMEGRYIASHDKPWNLMAWGFCTPTGEVNRQLKTVEGLCQEAGEVLSCGGSFMIYADPQRSGWLNDWQHDIFAKVIQFCRQRRDLSLHTKSIPDAVVLQSDSHVWAHNTKPYCLGDGYYGAEGALHALMENHFHVDILDETRLKERIGGYGLVMVAEQNPVAPDVLDAIEEYAKAGGTAVLSGPHLAEACGELVGVAPAGEARDENWFVESNGEIAIMTGPWQPVRTTDSEAYNYVLSDQQPGKDETEYPAVTVRKIGAGQIVAIHGRMMRSYYLTHQPRMRNFIGKLLDDLKVNRKVYVDGPCNLEVTLRSDENRVLVHLLNRATNPSLSPRQFMVEEVPPTGPITVRLRLDAKPANVTLQPETREVRWNYEDGWLTVEVDSVHVHDVIAVVLA